MFLYFSLIFLSGNASPAAWLDEQVKHHGPGFLISCLEGGGLLSQPTLGEVEAPFSIRGTLQWMDLLLAALDCYNTFTNLRCMQPQRILGGWIHIKKCLQVEILKINCKKCSISLKWSVTVELLLILSVSHSSPHPGTGEKSSFLPALRFFLTELSMQDVQAARACYKMGNAGQSLFSPRETEQYNYNKCSIIVRILEFSTMVLQKCPQDLWKVWFLF